jgi:Lon protease-like protein
MELPLFPLHVVLFPGTSIPLQVFELRYRAMMERVLSADRRFGVVAIRHGMEVGGFAETYGAGCLAEVEAVQRLQDGTMTLTAGGRQRFRIDARGADDPFPSAEVTMLDEADGDGAPDEHAAKLTAARAAIHRYLSVVAQLQGSDVLVPPLPDDLTGASFKLASVLQVDLPERQKLLEAPNAAARLELVTDCARREALLLDTVGPSVGRPTGLTSLN